MQRRQERSEAGSKRMETMMKQLMIDAMAAMMPYMRPLVLTAVAVAGAGLLGRVLGLRWLARLAGAFVVLVGVFFLACEGAGRFLGFEPTILFAAPADRALYRNQFPFWTIGIVGLGVGLLVRMLSADRTS